MMPVNNRPFLLIGLLLMLQTLTAQPAENCRSCHKAMQASCGLTCAQCHRSPNATLQPPSAERHPAVIPNPSREQWWQEKCVSCHADIIKRFKNSLHYSANGIISQTRYLWGAADASPQKTEPQAWKRLQRVGALKSRRLPDLADHLLATKCMACHFEADGREASVGRKRPAGCAACHIPLDQENGKPLHGHRMQKTVGDTVCLTCHSGNYAGGDYYGYFEHDYNEEYATPFAAQPRFGAYQHRLQPDVHQQAGMTCMDCHQLDDVKGHASKTAAYEGQHAAVRCSHCHGGFNGTTKLRVAANEASAFDTTVIAHKSFHRNVRCSACHARWSYQDYGLHLFLDESDHYTLWEDVIYQGDQSVIDLLTEQLTRPKAERTPALSRNRLSGEQVAGVWYKGWTFRRWETPVLGIGADGRYQIIRPLYQYFITYVDSSDNVWYDSVKPRTAEGAMGWSWDGYVPHTIDRRGRRCEGCHGNAKAAGMGMQLGGETEAAHAITIPSSPAIGGAWLLNKQEQKRLMEPSAQYRSWRAEQWRREGAEEWLR